MKRGLEARQITALERTQRSLEGWEKLKGQEVKQLVVKSARDEDERVLTTAKDIKEFIGNKIAKAKKCIANLETKGVVLKKEE
jgi:CO dehydrogenase/acetyl-CoA synthase epsilon subunit